jgi:hypothetical protein
MRSARLTSVTTLGVRVQLAASHAPCPFVHDASSIGRSYAPCLASVASPSTETPSQRDFAVHIQILNLLPETIQELAVRQKCEMFYTFEPSDWSPFCFIVKEKWYAWGPVPPIPCCFLSGIARMSEVPVPSHVLCCSKRSYNRAVFIETLKDVCKELGVSEKDCADALNISHSRLSQIKSASREVCKYARASERARGPAHGLFSPHRLNLCSLHTGLVSSGATLSSQASLAVYQSLGEKLEAVVEFTREEV